MEFLSEVYALLYYNLRSKEKEKITSELIKGNFSLTKISIRINSIWNITECITLSGRVQIFKWSNDKFRDHWRSSICRYAASGGQLQMLKWLRTPNTKYGAPYCWDEWTCAYAALNGHLKLLKWLRTEDPKYGTPCPWGEETCDCAVQGEELEVLKWLRSTDEKYGTPCPWDEECSYSETSTEIEDWLIANGCPRN